MQPNDEELDSNDPEEIEIDGLNGKIVDDEDFDEDEDADEDEDDDWD